MDEQAAGAKLYSRIGEVAKLTGLKPSIIRFWEAEFPEIAPQKSPSGQRLYSRQNIETIVTIKQLLYQEKLTIAGAKNRLHKSRKAIPTTNNEQFTDYLVAELLDIRNILNI